MVTGTALGLVILPVTVILPGSFGTKVTTTVLGNGEYTLGTVAPYAMTGTSPNDSWMIADVVGGIPGVDDAVEVYIKDNGRKTTIPERIPATSSFFICHSHRFGSYYTLRTVAGTPNSQPSTK